MALVLVVDDEPPIVDLLIDLVTDAGHTAIAARNGQEAFTLAQHHQPALIMSDVVMPVMDGYALLQAVRADPHLAHTLVILISASFRSEDTRYTLPTIFLPKPFDFAVITGFLHSIP